MLWVLWLTLVLSFTSSEAQYGNECQTPSNEAGKCLPIKSCTNIYSLLNQMLLSPSNVSPNERQRLQQSYCGQYNGVHHVCCANAQIRLNPIGEDILSNFTCGLRYTQKVAHGEVAEVFQFPFMALLKYTDANQFQCGGSLISPRYVLTAAHCITDSLVEVRLGEHTISTDRDCAKFGPNLVCADPVEDIRIEKIIKHDGYNTNNRLSHDIALLRLDREVTFKEHIKPVCLPLPQKLGNILGAKYAVAGWGNTEHGRPSDVLMWVEVPHKDNTDCERSYKLKKPLGEGIICAGGEQLMDSCKGDSGGPLLSLAKYNRKVRNVQFGIVSLGITSCGLKSYPALYTNVAHYMQWITDHMEI